MEKLPYKEVKPWSGVDNILDAFEALGKPYDMPIESYLNSIGRVIVKHDPVLIEVFGEDVVAEYERILAEAD